MKTYIPTKIASRLKLSTYKYSAWRGMAIFINRTRQVAAKIESEEVHTILAYNGTLLESFGGYIVYINYILDKDRLKRDPFPKSFNELLGGSETNVAPVNLLGYSAIFFAPLTTPITAATLLASNHLNKGARQ